jgi:hypothetical protein
MTLLPNAVRPSLLLTVLVVGGCASLTVREHFSRYGMPRAALDLDCPREKLELVQVDQPLDQPLWSGGTLVGVKGCSRRGVYVSLDNGTWILNSASTHGSADSAGATSPPNAKRAAAKK